MSERERRFYVTSVSSSTVVLSPEPAVSPRTPAGTGIAQITVTTTESTADGAFWGATGQCGRFNVYFEKIT